MVGVVTLVRSSEVVPVGPALSDAVTRSSVVGAADVVSITMASAPDVALVLFAGSNATTVRLWLP